MNYVTDTHALLWWFTDSPRISPKASEILEKSEEGENVISRLGPHSKPYMPLSTQLELALRTCQMLRPDPRSFHDVQYIEKWAREMGIEDEIKPLLSGKNLPNLT